MINEATESRERTCPECGETFTASHPAKVFCKEGCRVAYANLNLSRGKSIVPLLTTWRRHRDSEIGRLALREMCRIASAYIDEDKLDGRDSAIQVRALLDGFHVRKMDRPIKNSRHRQIGMAKRAGKRELAHAS